MNPQEQNIKISSSIKEENNSKDIFNLNKNNINKSKEHSLSRNKINFEIKESKKNYESSSIDSIKEKEKKEELELKIDLIIYHIDKL